jgi:hypothetical protein
MSLANDSLLMALGQDGFNVQDNVFIPSTQVAQSTAVPIRSSGTRVTAAPNTNNGALILPSLLTGEASGDPMRFVINDSAFSIVVFCAQGENMNGAANGSLTIPTGQAGFFFKVQNTIRGGGTTQTLDWRRAVVP